MAEEAAKTPSPFEQFHRDRRIEYKKILSETYEWDSKTRMWWDKTPEKRQESNPNYDGVAKIELSRELYADEIDVYNAVDETTITHDLTDSPLTVRVAANYHIHLPQEELERMLDILWSFGMVVYWPAAPGNQHGAWEVL